MHYLDEGLVRGRHGPWKPSWSFYYRSSSPISSSHRCIVLITLVAVFQTSQAMMHITPEQRISDLDSLLSGLSKRARHDCHDWGGMIGTSWATRNSERIRGLVVLNTRHFTCLRTRLALATFLAAILR